MARRATSLTKGREAARKPAQAAQPEPAASKPARRGKKAPPTETLEDTSMADASMSSGSDFETVEADVESTPDTKPRRGRRSKAASAPDASPDMADESAASLAPPAEPVAEPAPKPASTPRKTGRNREPEASAPPPLDIVEPTHNEPPSPVETDAPAVQWHADSDTVTFDWFSIEQVAASEGPNQPMAKLLLAARAEGANSRWPF